MFTNVNTPARRAFRAVRQPATAMPMSETPDASYQSRQASPGEPSEKPADVSALRLALAGNPNSGKTTLFNSLTGEKQKVGNYAGVTVDIVSGQARTRNAEMAVFDLPGTYSLTAYSAEEIVARNFLFNEKPDVVIDVIDAGNLERNLYLATQLLEMGVPIVLAMNMADVAEARGTQIDAKKLSDLLGVPIVSTVAHKGQGIEKLLETAEFTARFASDAVSKQRRCDYGSDVEPLLQRLQAELTEKHGLGSHARWFAVKLLEADAETIRRLRGLIGDEIESLLDQADRARHEILKLFGDRAEIILADLRYGFISGACTESVTQTVEARHERSDQIDAILTHRIWGLPIFAAMMYLTFQLTFTVGQIPMGWLENGFEWLGLQTAALWPRGADSILKSLLVDGIIGGVGGVLVFLPNILLLFMAIALLEGTGYMARAAYLMDGLMHRIGLHGKSFIPMLVGFGCTVPAILATRTLETKRDRLTTMMVLPLMSCGARLPIYALFIPAFFPLAWRGPMLWLIYFVGIALAVVCARLLRRTILSGESTPFVMELPPYRMPTATALVRHTWQRAWMYVCKAGTMILGASIVLWAMSAFPRTDAGREEAMDQMQQVRTAAIAQLDQLAAEAQIPPETLRQAAQAQLQMEIKQEAYWPDEPGFAQAQQAYQARINELAADGDGRLGRLIEAVQQIQTIRQDLAAAIEEDELEEASPEHALLVGAAESRLDRVRREHTELYPVATAWLDDFADPLDQRLQEIENRLKARQLAHSLSGRLGRAMEPGLELMGFDWRIGTALVGAFAAKEVFVSQMGIVFAAGEADDQSESLQAQLKTNYTPLIGFCAMLFCLIATPCIGTVAVTWREAGSWKWALLQWGGLTVIAFIVTTLVYQVGRLVW